MKVKVRLFATLREVFGGEEKVVELKEGAIVLVACVTNPEVCSRSGFCITRDIWGELKKAIDVNKEFNKDERSQGCIRNRSLS